MSRLSLEALSIVHAMLPQVEAHHAALMLRMWHHLSTADDRDALFEAVAGDGSQTLPQAFLAAVRLRVRSHWPRLRAHPRLCDNHGPVLEQAFGRALADVLNERDNPLVVNAWVATFHDFWTDLCAQGRTTA